MRSQGDGKGISLAPPVIMSLERSLEFIAPDEYVEATPRSLRLRKKILDATARKRAAAKVARLPPDSLLNRALVDGHVPLK